MKNVRLPPDDVRRERIARARRYLFERPLPPIAAKAIDLESLKKTVEDAASISAALWFSYIFVMFYIAVATGGVTHADLLLERPVRLPFLSVELPLTVFFLLAPIIFVVVHLYVLTHFVLLSRKAKRFHDQLIRQIPGRHFEDQKAATSRDWLRGQLSSNVFVQFLAGPRDVRDGGFGILLRTIAYVTLVIGPVSLLLLIQIQFLPYHNIIILWCQRFFIIIDLILLWWLWTDILNGRGYNSSFFHWTRWTTPLLAGIASVFVLLFSVFVATLPQEHPPAGPEWFPSKWFWNYGPADLSKEDKNRSLNLHEALFEGPVDEITRRRKSFFSNTLVLPGVELYTELRIDDPKKMDGRESSLKLRGRNLNGAIFDLARLPKVDFTGVDLKKAQLFGANLEGSILIATKLEDASLQYANLQGATLDKANLQRVSLDHARIENASLNGANLQHASLNFANLKGASFKHARLQDASLEISNLKGALFDSANLQGALLTDSNLEGSSFVSANLTGVSFLGTNFQGSSLDYANLRAVEFTLTNFKKASFVGANLQGASFFGGNFEGASLNSSNLQGASLNSCNLQDASLNIADLQGASIKYSNLNGASLSSANLSGSTLEGSTLHGTILENANLQGASFTFAQIQLASLNNAYLQGADLSEANINLVSFEGSWIWRTSLPQMASSLLLDNLRWKAETFSDLQISPWTTMTYLLLVNDLQDNIPRGEALDEAKNRVKRLDCKIKDLSPCLNDDNTNIKPLEIMNFEHKGVNKKNFRYLMIDFIRRNICHDNSGVHIIHGIINSKTLDLADNSLFSLLRNKSKCPIVDQLSGEDLDKLKRLEQETYEAKKINR